MDGVICLVADTYYIVEGGVKHTHDIIITKYTTQLDTKEFNIIISINVQREYLVIIITHLLLLV